MRRRLAFGVIAQADTRVALEPVDLIPNLQQPSLLPAGDAQLRQYILDVQRLCFGILVRDVAYVQNQVGFDDLFERRAKRGHQRGRQIRDEADGIRQNDA